MLLQVSVHYQDCFHTHIRGEDSVKVMERKELMYLVEEAPTGSELTCVFEAVAAFGSDLVFEAG